MPPSLAKRWAAARSYHHSAYPAPRLAVERDATISVCAPTRNCAHTVGPIVDVLVSLKERGVVDQVVVVDASSVDGTAEIAAERGAEVHREDDLMPAFGPTRGKGDAMWRALAVLTGDVVCYVDADTEGFGEHFVCGTVGPLVCDRGVEFVKAFYRRPLKLDGADAPEGGGRVTELTARPLLNLFYPDLAAIRQPLAGEVAARRDLLEQLPYSTGYAVEIAMLIDAYRAVGLGALAQVDLELRQNRHQPLTELGAMAYSVLRGVSSRLEREGRLTETPGGPFHVPGREEFEERIVPIVERPPMASLRARA